MTKWFRFYKCLLETKNSKNKLGGRKMKKVDAISRGNGGYGNDGYGMSFAKIFLGNDRFMKISENGVDLFGSAGEDIEIKLSDDKRTELEVLKKLSDIAGHRRFLDNFVFRRGSMPTVRGLAKYVDIANPGWAEAKKLLRSFKGRGWKGVTKEEIVEFLKLFNKCSKETHHE